MLFEFRTILASIFLGISLLASAGANASLIPILNGQVVNDTDLNIAWLADANYAKTSGYDADGLMTWSQAQNWIASLNAENNGAGHLGYNDWRLPATGPVNGISMNYGVSYNGSTDNGYNISEQGTAYAGSTGSEMAHLYYNSLDNKGYVTPSSLYPSYTIQPGYGLVNTGPFSNLQSAYYWSGTEYAPNTINAWSFGFNVGFQIANISDTGNKTDSMYALAVRSGQVATVPLPAAVWLFGAGMLGLLGVARRKPELGLTGSRNE